MKHYLIKSMTRRMLSQMGDKLGILNPYSIPRQHLEHILDSFSYKELVKTLKTITTVLIILLTFMSCNEPQKAKQLTQLKHMKAGTRTDNIKETTFRFPCGPPNGQGYYIAQGFQDNIKGDGSHLGLDINGVGGGNTDLGDTLYAIADGIVDTVEYVDYLTVYHKYKGEIVKVLYYHMYKPMVKQGQRVSQGQPLALMGNSGGAYLAHLHLEVIKNLNTSNLFYGLPDDHIDPIILFPNFKNPM